ncbi:isoprenylcysteine carboxylmethyltransferase family protein [Flavobacterium branchiophilum]|uniref:Protein-S-isoprenylcysteine O-methyltransferase Ste14 n=1 Tax=Flavobacterium branchiophilum (strain FL-15) TaxID=1034807 RepID=G2Z689_FLABF|nr:isoprenylcysteine carboxylmethyltransferase family protein [Flavobacterium branchiophilum]CCB70909.1 Hypothetical protein FBFL15_2964 [Flavobacterium branchiophilum FL-15]
MVSIQFLLFGLYAFDVLPHFKAPKTLIDMGLILTVFGVLVVLMAVLQLNTSLTIFPTPKSHSTLLSKGVFKYSRHPIYSGILMLTVGNAISQTSYYKLIISELLVVLFYFKSQYEEQQLAKKFPEYQDYQKKVRRFF